MRKLVTLSIAVLASFALAGAASATISLAITGSNTPGTNAYSIVLSVATSDGAVGYLMRVDQDGSFAGVAANLAPFPFSSPAGVLSLTPCSNCFVGNYGAVSGVNGVAATGSYTIGTLTLTVGAGDTINLNFSGPAAGILTFDGSTSVTITPTNLTGITIIPEPTTAGLLGLGIVGLVLAGRRNRA